MPTHEHAQPLDAPLAMYARVSRDGGRSRKGESFIATREQRSEAKQIAERYALAYLPDSYVDVNESGGSFDRPQFNRVLEMIEAGSCGGIIATSIDRVSRADILEALTLWRQVEDAGGRIYTRDGLVTSHGDEGMLTIMRLWAAAKERSDRKLWTEKSRRNAIERGVHLAETFGYERAGSGTQPKRLVPYELEAKVVRKAFRLRAQGWSWHRIANQLNEDGILPRPRRHKRDGEPVQSQWTHKAVALMIQRRVYLGEARSGSFVNAKAHKPLVSADVWRRANAARSTRRKGQEERYLLSGLVRCASCGYVMVNAKAKSAGLRYYRCNQRQGGAQGACPHPVSIPAAQLEQVMTERFAVDALRRPLRARLVKTNNDLEVLREREAQADAAVIVAHKLILRREVAGAEEGSLDYLAEEAEQVAQAARTARQHAEMVVRGLDLPHELDEQVWASASITQRRQWLSVVYAFVRAFPAPEGSWRSPVAERVQVVGRDEVTGDDWIAAGRVA